ncbi:hypothetical protein YC2023_054422 [Brassica napus]
MGILFTRMFSSVFGNKEARILVLGLDNAGKTTILYRLQMGEVVSTIPMIYVVDSSDTDRIGVAKEEFHAILETLSSSNSGSLLNLDLQEEELKGAVVLIFANKQDLPGALDDAAVTEALELHKIKSRQWAIFKTCAVKGEGLFEGLDWLSNTLKSGSG